jgi:hypothetical protein
MLLQDELMLGEIGIRAGIVSRAQPCSLLMLAQTPPPHTLALSDSPCGTKSITIHTKLCLHSCDGPANGMVGGQQHAGACNGCGVCEIEGATRLGRVLYGHVRRYLPVGHPMATDPIFGPPD